MNTLSNIDNYFIPNTLDGINIIQENINDNALLVDGTNAMLADLDVGGFNIKNLDAGIANNEAVNVGQLNAKVANYVDLTTAQTVGGTKTFSNQVTFNGTTKTNLVATDIPNAGTLTWLNSSGTQNIVGSKTFSNSCSFNGPNFTTSATTTTNLNNGATCNNKNIINVLNPVNSQDVATKKYVDDNDALKVNKAGDTMTGPLIINDVLNLNGGTATDTTVDIRDHTYIQFGEAGTGSDWAYLRQIGVSNDIKLSLDFHDDLNDGKFSLRSIQSTANPDTINEFFTASPNGFSMNAGLNMNTNSITNVVNPTNNQDVATKSYVDTNNNLKVNKSGDTMTGVLTLNGGVGPDATVDSDNKSNTYIKFNDAGSSSDFAYLRQIGSPNNYHISLDIHDDLENGTFSLRTVGSIDAPDTGPITFFRASGNRGFYNPNGLRVRDQNFTAPVDLEINPGVTTMIYRGGNQHGNLTLPSTVENGVRIEILNSSGQNLTVVRGNSLHYFNGNGSTTQITMGHPEMMVLIFYFNSWEGTKWNTDI